jgi:hypothetical protein
MNAILTIRVFVLLFALVDTALCGTPREALLAYKQAWDENDFDKSWVLEAKSKKLPEKLQQQERELARMKLEHRGEGWNFEILAERIDGDCAVIAISETQKGDVRAWDLDPVYLLKQDGEWRICRTSKRLKAVAPEKSPVMTKLAAWFKGFKQDVHAQQAKEKS